MLTFMQLFVLLLLVIIESGCTYNHCSRSVPQLIEGDGWSLTSNWFGERTVFGHGLNLYIRADNNDIKSELGVPHQGWKKHYPFTITAYINSIEDRLFIDWHKLKVIEIGREILLKEVRGPYGVSWEECTPYYKRFKDQQWVDVILIKGKSINNTCYFIEFEATNSDVPMNFQLELSGLQKSNEPLKGFKIMFSEHGAPCGWE